MVWTAAELTGLGIEDASSEGNIVTISIGTPAGNVVVMAEVDLSPDGKILFARGVHIHSDAGARTIGVANLRVLAAFVLERMNCDEASVEGAVRTTGANPGHRPRVLRFTRRVDPAAGG
jgi:hypothetical protein